MAGRGWIDLVVLLDLPLKLSFPVSKRCPSLAVVVVVVKRKVDPSSSFVEVVVVEVFHTAVVAAAVDNPLVERIVVLVNQLAAHSITSHRHSYEVEEEVLPLGDPYLVIQVQEAVHSSLVEEEGLQDDKKDRQGNH